MRSLKRAVLPIFVGLWPFAVSAGADGYNSARTGLEAASTRSQFRLIAGDVGAFYTAPLRWNGSDWAYFGAAVALVGGAHHFDSDVRNHFTRSLSNGGVGAGKSHDLQDAIPGAAVFAATWLGANLWNDRYGRREAWTMVEATVLSSITGFALKYGAGRERPDATADPNLWRSGGDSFPSLHTTAAFAIGTVLAESGNDEYRWVRRTLGYGIGGFTAYERLKHNAHWLSDTVAGAALGMSTARFVMHRRYHGEHRNSAIMLMPIQDGAMLTYTAQISR